MSQWVGYNFALSGKFIMCFFQGFQKVSPEVVADLSDSSGSITAIHNFFCSHYVVSNIYLIVDYFFLSSIHYVEKGLVYQNKQILFILTNCFSWQKICSFKTNKTLF